MSSMERKEYRRICEQVKILDKVLTSQQDEKYYFLHALPYDTHKYTQIAYFMLLIILLRVLRDSFMLLIGIPRTQTHTPTEVQ